eukprot:1158009-Pelagomonas_calceolata.AAC.3
MDQEQHMASAHVHTTLRVHASLKGVNSSIHARFSQFVALGCASDVSLLGRAAPRRNLRQDGNVSIKCAAVFPGGRAAGYMNAG